MAYYAALTSLLQTLEQIPQPPVHQQITSSHDKISTFHNKVSRLLMILGDFPQKRSSMIQDLEGWIRDASYEAEDIIESHISRVQVVSRSLNCGGSSCFWEVISAFQNMIPMIQLCERSAEYMDEDVDTGFQSLEKMMEEFDSILESLSKRIDDWRLEDRQSRKVSRIPASSEDTPVGLDVDLLKIKDRLTGSLSKLDIISIVGMGGIGKTTLARNIYNDSLIQQHFDTRAWVVVSQEYHVREMLTGLLDSTRHGGGELHQKSIQQLSEVLYKSLKGRRYLIVMDDVWDTKAWDEIRMFFPDDNNGSRVILTTRLSEVAIYVKSDNPVHRMSLLSSEASWNLLRDKVFGIKYCPPKLEKIGVRIAKGIHLLLSWLVASSPKVACRKTIGNTLQKM